MDTNLTPIKPDMFRGQMMWDCFEWFAIETETGYILQRKCEGCWVGNTGQWNDRKHLVESYITKDEIQARTARVSRLRSYGETEMADVLELGNAKFL